MDKSAGLSDISGTVSDTLTEINTQPFTENKIYCCLEFNDSWHLFTPEIVLTYFEAPLILKQPVSEYVNQGDSVVFEIDAIGIETPACQLTIKHSL